MPLHLEQEQLWTWSLPSGDAAGNGDVTCDNNVLRLYGGNVACLAAMPLVDVLCYVLSGNAADESDAA